MLSVKLISFGTFHIAKDFVIEGARTEDVCDEIWNSGECQAFTTVHIFGDCNGRNRDTRGTLDDYAIIKRYFERRGLRVVINVPKSNPDLRASENQVNALCLSESGHVRLKIYKEAKVAHEGLSFTKYKKGANLIQDDSDYFQHVSTAIRYWCWEVIENLSKFRAPVTVQKYR